MGILTNIREMSDNKKNFFSFFGAIILTSVIIYIWFPWKTEEVNLQEEKKLSSVSPLHIIKEGFSNFKNIISDSDNTISNQINEINTTGYISSSTELTKISIPIEVIDIASTTGITTDNTN